MHHVNSKPSVVARPLAALALTFALALGLTGCGQKGPLSLPPASSSASAPTVAR